MNRLLMECLLAYQRGHTSGLHIDVMKSASNDSSDSLSQHELAEMGLLQHDEHICLNRAFEDARRLKAFIDQRAQPTKEQVTSQHSPKPHMLNDRQQQALRCFQQSSLIVVSGGPGTGKTFTARYLVEDWLNRRQHEVNGSHSLRVLLVAPTGKAAQRLSASVGDSIERKSPPTLSFVEMHTKTIHRALRLHSGAIMQTDVTRAGQISADLIVIDEASMIDMELARRLLASIRSSTDVIILGDPDQLPPIGPGHFLKDIICYLDSSDGPHIQLTEAIRTDRRLELAHYIESFAQHETVQLPAPSTTDKSLQVDFNQNVEHITHKALDWLEHKLHSQAESMILSPFDKGPLGSQALNSAYRLRRGAPVQRQSDPILLTQNLPHLGLSNGDVGHLHLKHGDWVVRFSTTDGPVELAYTSSDLLRDAWAMTIHKSQGSEYDHTCLIIPPQELYGKTAAAERDSRPELFHRQLLYTGLTRARQSTYVLGCANAFEAAAASRLERRTIPLTSIK